MNFTFNRIGKGQPITIFDVTSYPGSSIELFEDGKLTGIVADTNFRAVARFQGDPGYIAEWDTESNSKFDFRMDREDGTLFAWGEVQARHIVFPDHEGSYSMEVISNTFTKETYRYHYRFMMNNKVHCEIRYKPMPQAGWFKRNFTTAEEKGQIWLSDSLNRDYLLGFMLVFTRSFDVTSAPDSD